MQQFIEWYVIIGAAIGAVGVVGTVIGFIFMNKDSNS